MTDEEFAKTFPTMKWLLPHREPSPPKHSWSELPGNVVPSAVDAATGLYEMVRHPIRTLRSLETVAGGAMNLMGADELNAYLADRGLAGRRNPEDIAREEAAAIAVGQALKDRYWGLENIKNTLITDPVGSLFDVAAVATGVGGAVRGSLSVGSKARLAEAPGTALNEGRSAVKELGQIADNEVGRPSVTRVEGAPAVDDVREYPMFDPPNRPQRPLEADYTAGVKENEVDEAGNLLVDMDGDPFTAKYKVGRLTKEGGDVGLTDQQYKALIEELIQKKIEIVPRSEIGGSSGRLSYDPISNRPSRLRLANDIKRPRKRNRVLRHEGGHALHVASGLNPADAEMLGELRPNYSTLATGNEYRKDLVLPNSRGYTGESIEHELIAEGFRAALTNPNYMKSVAPKAYATLRKWIKSKSELAKLIQLNSIGGAAIIAALGATGQDDEDDAAEAPLERDSETNFPGRGMTPLPGRLAPFQRRGEAAKADASGRTELAKTLAKRGLYPQATKNKKLTKLVRALIDLEARKKRQFYGGSR